MRKQLVLLTVVALAMLSIATSASAQAANGPSTWHVQLGVASADMARMGMAFYPSDLAVHPGDVIVFSSGVPLEPHTVTFGAPNDLYLNPFAYFAPYGGSTFTGEPLNSGWLGDGLPFGTSFTLTVDAAPGTYSFRCGLHPLMRGSVTVVPADQALPFTDAQNQHRAFAQETVDLAHARVIATQSAVAAKLASDIGGTGIEVAIGGGDGTSTVMRFAPDSLTVHVGDTVTFVNRDPYTPHTVTFGEEPPGAPDSLIAPYGDPTNFDGTTPLNSGILWVPFGVTMFQVTFTAAGTFSYICGLHDLMGMTGSVTVVA